MWQGRDIAIGVNELDARAALNARVGKNGQIISNLDVDQEMSQAWLKRALAEQVGPCFSRGWAYSLC